jgi:aldehyde:ferredoxin oxidoreductase
MSPTTRDRIDALIARLPREAQYPTQGKTLFIDLARRDVRFAYTPKHVVTSLLEGRGGNMFYLWNLLDPGLDPLDPEVPLIFGSGVLTGLVPSAARGNVTSRSPETGVLMDSNAGDYFPSFAKLSGYDRIVLHGRAEGWTFLHLKGGEIRFLDGAKYAGLDNIDLREQVERDFAGVWNRDLAMVNITRAGESLALCSGIMGGPKAIYARGGTGAKMGALKLKAILIQGFDVNVDAAHAFKPYNREIATKLLATSVVKNALRTVGTPFLYKPSRLLGAMGTKNNQETTWTDQLDAEHIDPYRPGMTGCFRCPVNCRPLNDLSSAPGCTHDRYSAGDGPEYVTLGKFGPNIGISRVEDVLRLNNICNDLGLDTASTGSAIAWAMELVQRGVIDSEKQFGLALRWGDAAAVEKLLFQIPRREGLGAAIAASSRAIEQGFYPAEAAHYRMTVKHLFQSDPHDARILKAFALGLAVATRGMDHLRNRVTLEINAKLNSDPAFKRDLYGGDVSVEPNSYEGKEIAVRRCENTYAVGDSVGMCRFTTKLFNSPSLPGYEQFSQQVENVTGLKLSPGELDEVGLNINGVERLINNACGARRKDDTLPRRWFEEPIQVGSYIGERIKQREFEELLTRFYRHSQLNDQGAPVLERRARLERMLSGFAVTVKVPRQLGDGLDDEGVVVSRGARTVGEVLDQAAAKVPGLADALQDGMWNVAVNGSMLLRGAEREPVKDGDVLELVGALAGG